MKRNVFTFIGVCLIFIAASYAQIPTEAPHPDNNPPIDLSETADIIIYIVLPVIILLLLVVRYRKRKK
jgi:hypothetical protein